MQGTVNCQRQFGIALAAGDFNGDSRSDLAIGAPGENIPQGTVRQPTTPARCMSCLAAVPDLTATNNQFWNENITGISTTAARRRCIRRSVGRRSIEFRSFADLAIGIPNATVQTFAAKVPRGCSSEAEPPDSRHDDSQLWNSANRSGGANATIITVQNLAVGDFSGDKIGDMASGIPQNDPNSAVAGDTHIVYGQFGTQPMAGRNPPSISD